MYAVSVAFPCTNNSVRICPNATRKLLVVGCRCMIVLKDMSFVILLSNSFVRAGEH